MNRFVYKFVLWAKNVRSKDFFTALEKYVGGRVLDIGGWDFFTTVIKIQNIKFDTWVNLENDSNHLHNTKHEKYESAVGSGEQIISPDNSFDTVINSLVLEHTFEPLKMVKEIGRVLKPGGYAIFLIPQTAVIHHIPNNFYNFTKFWITKAMAHAGLRIIELKPIGGSWTSTASHFVYFFFQAFRFKEYSSKEYKRNFWFYILFPFMTIYATIGVVICVVFSLGDLNEEPNYHLVVATKDRVV